MKFIGRIPDTMAKVVHGLISEYKVNQLIVKFDGKYRGAPEETWTRVGEIVLSPFIFFYWVPEETWTRVGKIVLSPFIFSIG